MCRLAYLPDAKNAPFDLGEFFAYLRDRAGGHGNGLGWFDKSTREPMIEKGIGFTCDDAAMMAEVIDPYRGILFHTRLASMGNRTDTNCHPFNYKRTITCHNGTWMKAHDLKWQVLLHGGMTAEQLVDCTDSEIIAWFVGNYGFDAARMVGTGVILSLNPSGGKVVVHGDFQAVRFKEGWYYASVFPQSIGNRAQEWVQFKRGTVADLFKSRFVVHEGGTYSVAAPRKKGKGKWNRDNGRGQTWFGLNDDVSAAEERPVYRQDLMDRAVAYSQGEHVSVDADEVDDFLDAQAQLERELEDAVLEEELESCEGAPAHHLKSPTNENGKRVARKPRRKPRRLTDSVQVNDSINYSSLAHRRGWKP